MKTRSVVREKEKASVPSSIPCFKVNGIRKINKEERDKRIGLSEEKIKELEKSSRTFFQTMIRIYGYIFWFKWQEGGTPPLGFRMKPDSINNSMWFLFTNELEESLQNNADKAMYTRDSFRWMVTKKEKRERESLFRPGQYFDNGEM